MSSPSLSRRAASPCTVGLVLSKPSSANTSDPFYSQRVQIVLWACRKSDSSPAKKTLTYYSYWDHPRQDFLHTDALLQRLAPISVVHVAAGEGLASSPSTKKKSNSNSNSNSNNSPNEVLIQRLLHWLEEHKGDYAVRLGSADENDNDESDDAATETIVQHHASFRAASNAMARLPAVLQDLLLPADGSSTNNLHEQALRVAGDVELQSQTPVSKALVFFLQAVGLWQANEDIESTSAASYSIEPGVLESHLYLDRTAAEAIHLWPPCGLGQAVHVGGQKHNNSLAGLLSQPCQTVMAKRLLESWLRQPLVSLSGISQRQEAVALLVQRSVGRDAIRSEGLRLFRGQDLSKLAATLAAYAENPEESDDTTNTASGSTRKALQALYELYTVSSQKLPLLLEQVETALADNDPNDPTMNGVASESLLDKHVLEPLRQAVTALERSVELATSVLDMEAAPREFLVRPSYKEELTDVQQELQHVQAELQACHDDMNEQWAQVTGKSQVVRLESCGGSDDSAMKDWQFRLPDMNDSKILKSQFGSAVKVHRLLKNGVYFSTKELQQLASKQQDLLAEYDRHQRQVALDALKVAATYQPVLEQASDAIALLDVLAALAHVAAYSPHGYCRPVMTDSEEDGMGIELQEARHPCVELQENMEYIPNDSRLMFGESSFLIVTGPNSTYEDKAIHC
jgi:DNA mismatch repair ATPase MutS